MSNTHKFTNASDAVAFLVNYFVEMLEFKIIKPDHSKGEVFAIREVTHGYGHVIAVIENTVIKYDAHRNFVAMLTPEHLQESNERLKEYYQNKISSI